jgi:hypothetical protein
VDAEAQCAFRAMAASNAVHGLVWPAKLWAAAVLACPWVGQGGMHVMLRAACKLSRIDA